MLILANTNRQGVNGMLGTPKDSKWLHGSSSTTLSQYVLNSNTVDHATKLINNQENVRGYMLYKLFSRICPFKFHNELTKNYSDFDAIKVKALCSRTWDPGTLTPSISQERKCYKA
ncbi:unnamed protein product, partial [Dovyalis caffra]